MRNTIIKASLIAGGLLLLPLTAYSAGLGKLTVTSALGQPLRAEVDLLTDSNEDVTSLAAQLASLDAFKQANVARAPVLRTLRFVIAKRADGQPYIKISSAEPINDPFLDMLIELNWASGRLVREYTILLDPPAFSDARPLTPVAAPSVKPLPAAAPKPAMAEEGPVRPRAATYGPVKKGDTLTKIARGVKAEGISLDQVLVGLYRSNPDAFAGNNMNRLKTGRILRIPEGEQLASVGQPQAKQEIRAQAADWHAYRQKLAAVVAAAQTQREQAPKQAVSGKISAAVEDKAATGKPVSRDVLKLSKGATPGEAGAPDAQLKTLQDRVNSLQEDAIARQQTIQETNARIAALEKNIQEMQKLLALKSQSMAELQKQAEAAKGQPAPAAPTPVPATKPVPVEAAAKPAVSQPAPAAKPAVPKPAVKPKAAAPLPKPAESPWYREIIDNPLYLAGGTAVLLAGLLWLVMLGNRRRKGLTSFEDSIMTGGDLKANTVLGETAGGVIDTGDTSFLTDFSQAGLGTIDTNDVDPIAEAEVYMAYGRDAQAEEILKEAVSKDPNRHEIHLKLLEIYAARKNLVAFETLASELYAAIGGKPNPIWDRAAELGRELDPNNPLYGQARGAAAAEQEAPGKVAAVAGAAVAAAVVDAAGQQALATGKELEDTSPDLEFDLDQDLLSAGEQKPEAPEKAPAVMDTLDFEMDFAPAETPVSEPDAERQPEIAAAPEAPEADVPDEEGAGLSFDLDTIIPQAIEKNFGGTTEAPAVEPVESAEASGAVEMEHSMDFDFSPEEAKGVGPDEESIVLEAPAEEPVLDFDFNLDEVPAPVESPAQPSHELDFSGISLDLEGAPTVAAEAEKTVEPESEQWHEVATKLDLAKAYLEMGDKEGAREILQEVVQEGDSRQQGDAQALLAELG